MAAERISLFGNKYAAVLRYQFREAPNTLTIPASEVPKDGSLQVVRRDQLALIAGPAKQGTKGAARVGET